MLDGAEVEMTIAGRGPVSRCYHIVALENRVLRVEKGRRGGGGWRGEGGRKERRNHSRDEFPGQRRMGFTSLQWRNGRQQPTWWSNEE